jgi:PAT family beta-lactamase induction signal transducer AmpG
MTELRSAYHWIPGMYVMQGLPFALVSIVSPVLFKDFNFSNTSIALYTSLFTLPWVLKFLMAPALERFDKRNLVLAIQLNMATLTILLALSLYLTAWYYLASLLFITIAFMGAIYDIHSDGLYLHLLSFRNQASLIGIRSLFYQLGRIVCRFGLLFIVGYCSASLGKERTWSLAFLLLALFIFAITFYQHKNLPQHIQTPVSENPYRLVLNEFLQLPQLINASIFLLLYEMPEAQLMKIVPLYIMDKISQGGLGLNVEDVGIIYGGIGMCAMLLGITLSGMLLNHYTLRTCLIPFTVISALGYINYLSLNHYHHYWHIVFCIAFSAFGFGLGNGAYMLYLIKFFSKGTHAMSLYAIGTAIMLLGFMLSGSVSGYLQAWLGYNGFFSWVAIASVGTILLAIYNTRRVLS